MAAAKLPILWSYAMEEKTSLEGAADLEKVAAMCLERDPTAEEKAACAATYAKLESTGALAVAAALDWLTSAANAETPMMKALQDAKPAASSSSSSSGAGLAALFADDDAGDDEDDADATPAIPVVKGKIKVKEGKFVWSGKWAMSKEKYNAGETNKFRYICVSQDAKDKSAAPPAEGDWDGFFLVKMPPGEDGEAQPDDRVDEKGVKIRFKKSRTAGKLAVVGNGVNKYGRFLLSGTYSSGKCMAEKIYDEEEEEDDDDLGDVDEADENELADLKADAMSDGDLEALKRKLAQMEEDEQRSAKKARLG